VMMARRRGRRGIGGLHRRSGTGPGTDRDPSTPRQQWVPPRLVVTRAIVALLTEIFR
jgi:hypothetical protein